MRMVGISIGVLVIAAICVWGIAQHIWQPSVSTKLNTLVLANTVTSSLDGQRRYLLVKLPSQDQVQMTVSPSELCPVGATATVSVKQHRFFDRPHYQFLYCIRSE